MRHTWVSVVLVSILSIFFAAPPRALAQEDAKALFMAGQEAYQQGDYDKAIAKWNAAYAKDPKPLIQYNLGGAYERVGRIDAAVAAFDKYLATAPDDDRVRRAEVSAKVERLRARLRETGLVVEGAPDGASIDIDGKSWGLTPRPDAISLDPGSHRVTLKKDGFESFTAVVAVGAGERVTVAAEMKALPDAPQEALPAEAAPITAETKADSKFPVVPVVLMAGGGAVLVGGLVVGLLASGKASDAKTDDDSDAKSAKSLALVSDIMMGAGIVAAGVGVVLLLVGGDDEETAPQAAKVRVAPMLGPSVAGVTGELRF